MGPPCRGPVPLKGRCISGPPAVEPATRLWVGAATPRTSAASCTARGANGLQGKRMGSCRGGGQGTVVQREGRGERA